MNKDDMTAISEGILNITRTNRKAIESNNEAILTLMNNGVDTFKMIVGLAKIIKSLNKRIEKLEPTVGNTKSRVVFNESKIDELQENLENSTSKIQEWPENFKDIKDIADAVAKLEDSALSYEAGGPPPDSNDD